MNKKNKKNTFGMLLRCRRVYARTSLRALAKEIGLSFAYLSHIERGERMPPSSLIIKKIALILKCKHQDLINKAIWDRGIIEFKLDSKTPYHKGQVAMLLVERWDKLSEMQCHKILEILHNEI